MAIIIKKVIMKINIIIIKISKMLKLEEIINLLMHSIK